MKWTPARVGLAAVVVVAGLYGWDAVMPRQGELVPFPLRVSFEEYANPVPVCMLTAGHIRRQTSVPATALCLSMIFSIQERR